MVSMEKPNLTSCTMESQTLSSKERAIRLISRIQSAHIQQIRRQRRENHRQCISLPAKIRPLGVPGELEALTRDLSSEGVGMITAESVATKSRAEIEMTIANCTETIYARCQWCKPSGIFFLSGWKFFNSVDGE